MRLALLFAFFALFSCETNTITPKEKQDDANLFSILTPYHSGLNFTNRLRESERMNGLFYEYFYNGGGVAVGDVNNDGLADIYFTSNLEANKLFLNRGNLKFEDVTNAAGVMGNYGFPTGVTMVDINQDGLLDIYICKSGQFSDPDKRRNELYVNQGMDQNGRLFFKEQAANYGLDIPTFSTQATFFDYDRDNDLDMFLINHGIKSFEGSRIAELANEKSDLRGERLYENIDGFYKDVTDQAKIINNNLGYCLGVGIGDFNNDHWPDVYVSIDYSGKDHLYINNQDGTFKESILVATKHISNFSMGNDVADFNNDGRMDIISVDMASEDNYGTKTSMGGMNPEKFQEVVNLDQHHQYMYNALQLNRGIAENGFPRFSEVAQMAGIAKTDWSWAPLIFDMNNDGLKDLFISNGIKRDFRNNDFVNFRKQKDEEVKTIIRNKQTWDIGKYVSDLLDRMPERKKPNYFYKNEGNLKFEKMNGLWVEDIPNSSNGAAYADFDNDGDLDIVVNNTDEPALIYKNNGNELVRNAFIKIKLNGPAGNLNGIGTRIEIFHDDRRQYAEQYLSRGFQSSVDRILHFGLGETKRLDKLTVIWPDGRTQTLHDELVNQTIQVNYEDADSVIVNTQSFKPEFFEDITTQFGLKHKHSENEFDDYAKESLLPHKMSRFGPALAVGDINLDGLDDFFIGGAVGEPGQLYLQLENSTFVKAQSQPWIYDKGSEDVGATFFDADNDQDMDLYVVSGGNEFSPNDPALQDRLYLNNGKGDFLPSEALPEIRSSGSRVVPCDFDLDGDTDLFIGGRLIPGKYPFSPKSFLLRNESTPNQVAFVDVTNKIAPPLLEAGMVTDAVWTDLNGDTLPDLVIVGEWMPVMVMINVDGKYEDRTEFYGLNTQRGWWFSLRSYDFDRDGDQDLVAGNLGLNYKYKATVQEPFEVFADDFDQNGSLDVVLGYHDQGHLYPLRGRECSSNQMPFIKHRFPTYDSFAKASLGDIYEIDTRGTALNHKVYTFSTTYFENVGGGFEPRPLPRLAQISSVNSIALRDVDDNGTMDMILAGNLYASEVETTRNDASIGLLLKGDNKGNFTAVGARESGLIVEGDVKNVLPIKLGRQWDSGLVVGKNDDYIQLIRLKK